MEIFLAVSLTALFTVFIVDGSKKRRAYLSKQKVHRD